MKEQITWQKLKGDSVNGYGVQITYIFTSFDASEIGELEEWCKKHIKAALIFENVKYKGDENDIL